MLLSSARDKSIELPIIIKQMPDYNKEVDVLNYITATNGQTPEMKILEKFSNVFDVQSKTSVATILKDACDVVRLFKSK